MTIYSGSLAASPLSGMSDYDNPAIGNYPLTREWDLGELAPTVTDDDLGSKSSTQPIDEPRTLRNAPGNSKVDQFGFLDFFNQIHIQYTRLDLGNIVSTQNVGFYVFSSYFVPRTLNDVTALNDLGLVLTEPGATPLVFEPWEEKDYQLSVSTEGPPSVDATYTFEFDVGDFLLRVTGTRLVLFPYEPDGPVIEVLDWSTDVLESYDGTEQRISLRGAARQRFEYEVLTEGQQDTELRGLLFDWMPRVFGVPVWFEQRRLTTAITAGDSVISVSTLNGDFRVGGLVMVWQNEDTYEVVGIDSMTDTEITLDVDLINAYNRKAYVMPVRTAYMTSQVQRSKYPTNVARTSVGFTTIDNENYASTTGASTYSGKVLLDDANYIDATGAEDFQRPVTVIDNESGKLYQFSRTDRSRFMPRKRWEVKTMAELWRIRKLLHHFDGNRVSFYLPSFREDLVVTQTIAGNTPTLRIEHCNFTNMYQGRKPFSDLRLVLTNGNIINREITDANVDGDEEVITVNAPFSTSPIFVDDIERVELLSLVRIANDRAKLTHRRAGTATIDINLISVKE